MVEFNGDGGPANKIHEHYSVSFPASLRASPGRGGGGVNAELLLAQMADLLVSTWKL